MSKRSHKKFNRIPHDNYQTPREAVEPLWPFISRTKGVFLYYEPCASKGALIKAIDSIVDAKCVGSSDREKDARTYKYITEAEYFVTNPPWSRELLHPIIENLRNQLPTWLLFDSDWAHTKQAIPYLRYCHKIVAVGRIKWIPGSQYTGKDNVCWYLFDKWPNQGYVKFYGKQEKQE